MTANPPTCQKCGSPIKPGMKFCESCGAQIEASPACTQCGSPVAPSAKFCESCGAAISSGSVPVAAAASSVPDAAPVQKTGPAAESPAKTSSIETVPVVVPAPATPPAREIPLTPKPPLKAEEKPVQSPAEKPGPAPVKEPPKTPKVSPKETGPKKPVPQQTMIIAAVIVLALLGAALYFFVLPMLSGPGVSSPNLPVVPVPTVQANSPGIPAPTPAVSQTGAVSFIPGPTDVPPFNRAVVVDVERDAITSIITVTFQGGEGQYGVRELVVTLTRSDGTTEIKSFKPENRGTFITLQGTEKTDRVEVTANFYNGETYKVIDQIFEYKKRGG